MKPVAAHLGLEPADQNAATASRLKAIRGHLAAAGADGLLIPRTDPFLGENIAPAFERLAWATGFTGSAGLCLLLSGRALMFLDGRYLLQGRAQTDPSQFEIVDISRCAPEAWICEHLGNGKTVAFDPWLHTPGFLRKLSACGFRLLPLGQNLVDLAWNDRQAPERGEVHLLPCEIAGEGVRGKCHRTAKKLVRENVDAALLSSAESVNWLLNIRGDDVPHIPVVQARALLHADASGVLFLDPGNFLDGLRAHLPSEIQIADPDSLEGKMGTLSGRRLSIDPNSTPERIWAMAKDAGIQIEEKEDPVAELRAQKNPTEIEGIRHAHQLDGSAVVELLSWLDRRNPCEVTEIEIVKELGARRVATGELNDFAFDTIAAAGPNAALPHYCVTQSTNRALRKGEFLLLDSGGQYFSGTTDLTRTIPVGNVSGEMRRVYTLVLKSMIAVSTLRFPPGTPGIAIDAIARESLWRFGHDYPHGTGHGVGFCLSVHEGPFALSARGPRANRKLQPGYVLSNEPACYFPGKFGIRIENLLLLKEAREIEGGSVPVQEFESLTLAPIDKRPIEASILGEDAASWLDAYHARVEREIGPLVSEEAQFWLAKACAPLSAVEH